jgi:hypothetical protein
MSLEGSHLLFHISTKFSILQKVPVKNQSRVSEMCQCLQPYLKKEEEKNTKWPFLKVFSSFWEDILYISPFSDNQNKYFDCSAKFKFSNITKILNLENRRMMINISLPSWYLCWCYISLESITRTVVGSFNLCQHLKKYI